MATTKPTPKKTVRPFLFEHSFDVPEEPREVAAKKEEEEAPPTYSEAELQAARDDAYKAGMQAGLQEAGASIEQQVAATLDVVAGTLHGLAERQASMNEAIAHDAIDLAVAAMKKLLPATAEANGAAEVSALVQEALSRLLQEPRVTIRVAEKVAADVESQLGPVAARAGFDGKTTIVPDPELGPADCRILWNDGEANRDVQSLMDELDAMIGALPRPLPDTSPVTPHAPPLGSGGPIDVEIDLESEASRDGNESPDAIADDSASERGQTAGPA